MKSPSVDSEPVRPCSPACMKPETKCNSSRDLGVSNSSIHLSVAVAALINTNQLHSKPMVTGKMLSSRLRQNSRMTQLLPLHTDCC